MPDAALQLPRELTLASASAALASLTSAIAAAVPKDAVQAAQGRNTIDIDASPLTVLDSSALAVLLQCRRIAQEQGADVRLLNAPAKLERLARLYGVQELIADVQPG